MMFQSCLKKKKPSPPHLKIVTKEHMQQNELILKLWLNEFFTHVYAICIRIECVYHPDKDTEYFPGAPSQWLDHLPNQY